MVNLGSRAHDVLPGPCTPQELGAACERHGVRCVQLALGKSFSFGSGARQINPGMGTYVRDALGEHGVSISVLGCYFNMIHPDLSVREKGIRKFEAYLANARFFGAPIVASETGSVNVDFAFTKENFTDEHFEEAARVVARLARTAERFGAIVGIEPGINHPIYSPQRMRNLLDCVDSPFVGVVLDPTAFINQTNAEHQLELARQSMELFGNRVVAMHLKDWTVADGRFEYRNLGEGKMKVADVLHTVADRRPLLPVLTEATTGLAIDRAMGLYRNVD